PSVDSDPFDESRDLRINGDVLISLQISRQPDLAAQLLRDYIGDDYSRRLALRLAGGLVRRLLRSRPYQAPRYYQHCSSQRGQPYQQSSPIHRFHLLQALTTITTMTPMKHLGPEARAARERPPLRGDFHSFRAPHVSLFTLHSSLITHHSLSLITVSSGCIEGDFILARRCTIENTAGNTKST